METACGVIQGLVLISGATQATQRWAGITWDIIAQDGQFCTWDSLNVRHSDGATKKAYTALTANLRICTTFETQQGSHCLFFGETGGVDCGRIWQFEME